MDLFVGIQPRQFIRVAVALINSVSNEQAAGIIRPDTGEHMDMMNLRTAAELADFMAGANGIPHLPFGHVPMYPSAILTLQHAMTVIGNIPNVVNDNGEHESKITRMLQASINLLHCVSYYINPFVYPPAFPPPQEQGEAPGEGPIPPPGGEGGRRRTRRHRVRKARTVRRRTVHRR
jgi:hypothetical protein